VPVDGGGHREPQVPVLGQLRAAPQGELREAQHPRRGPVQRPVRREHDRQPGRQLARRPSQAGQREPHPLVAPCGAVREGVGVQQVLVRGDDVRLVRVRQRRLEVEPGQPPGVVVEQEQRRHDRRAAVALPHRVRVLRRDDVELAADLDEVLVPGGAGELHRVARRRPQLVVARRPDHLREPLAEQAQRAAQGRDRVRDVAGDDQPVAVGVRADALHDLPVPGVHDVQVARRQQRGGGRRAHRADATVTAWAPSCAR
jgi:hypothetical protein